MMHGELSVYALSDPFTEKIRYIGISNNPAARLSTHISTARANDHTHRSRWIRSLLRMGSAPVLEILESPVPNAEAEKRWIAAARQAGLSITNHSEGGDGTWGYRHTEETRAKMRRLDDSVLTVTDSSGCRHKAVIRLCKECGSEFKAICGEVRRGFGDFCCKGHQISYFMKRRPSAIKPGEEFAIRSGIRYRTVPRACDNCGGQFQAVPSRAKWDPALGRFCSVKCQAVFTGRKRKEAAVERGIHYISDRGNQVRAVYRNCEECGVEYSEPLHRMKNKEHFYCSHPCSVKGSGRIRRVRVSRKCAQCGAEFSSRKSSPKLCCSVKCANVLRGSTRWRAFNCEECGKETRVWKSVKKMRFCSKSCGLVASHRKRGHNIRANSPRTLEVGADGKSVSTRGFAGQEI